MSKTEKILFSHAHSPKEHIFQKLGYYVESLCVTWSQTDTYRQTYIHQSDYREKPFQGFRSYLPSAHYQGAV